MRPAELQQALQAVNPAAVLVSPHVVERVIEQVYDLPTVRIWEVPHRRSCVVDRQVLFRHIEQEDLDLNPGQLLPPTVILLARLSNEDLNNLPRDVLLVEYWRRLFHACIHYELGRRWAAKELTHEHVRDRIEAIGRSEFAESNQVLHEENYLVPEAPEQDVYIEFAAVFLELRYFAANLVPAFFPAIGDSRRVEEILAQDLDVPLLFAQTRLPGAPNPKPATDTSSDESHDFFRRLMRSAERAVREGNTVRAAILRTKAARVAPGNLTAETREQADADLQGLMRRLQAALELTEAEAAEWAEHLSELLDRADQGLRPVEADILFDLQKACVDHEKDIYTVSVIDWLLSAGKWPIKRPLPSLRLVRVGNHIRAARQRLSRARLSDASRQHLLSLMDSALDKSENRLRTRLRPVLEAALYDVGLEPANPPQRTAFETIVEEILDRIIAHGFLTFSDLRDTLSRNELKLPDLGNPQNFVRGDPLLRIDRRLAALLDGVYRPSEVYLRGLERFTALNFGTKLGRLVTRYVTIPFGIALLLLESFRILLELVLPKNLLAETPAATDAVSAVAGAAAKVTAAGGSERLPGLFDPLYWGTVFVLGFFILGMMHWPVLRARCVQLLAKFGSKLRLVFLDLPRRLIRRDTVDAIVGSWPFQVFYWVLFKPLLVCTILWLTVPLLFTKWYSALTFGGAVVFVNSTFGRAFGNTVVQSLANFYNLLRAGLLPGLFRLILYVFKQLVDGLEYLLFSLDEYFRYRSGDSRFRLAVRTVLSPFWFPISYLIRFYSVVLIEPMINPIKLPLTILAAKLVYPLLSAGQWVDLTHFTSPLVAQLEPYLGSVPAWLLVIPTLWLLPDAFVFLFWEMKENWRLYKANRPRMLTPVPIGSHGETLRGLLEPGFHSGTIPRLYSRLRRAERLASRTGTWQYARYYRHQLNDVSEAVSLFVTRNLVSLVSQSKSWAGQSLHVGTTELACSRVRVELTHGACPEKPAWVQFEERHGWIVAGMVTQGWIAELSETLLPPLNNALAGLYKLAGVDLVDQQVRALLPSKSREFELSAGRLTVWADAHQSEAVYYDLKSRTAVLRPQTLDGNPVPGWPEVDPGQLLFSRVPLTWDQWLDCWQKDQEGLEHPRMPGPAGMLLLPQALPLPRVDGLRDNGSSPLPVLGTAVPGTNPG